jgi:hypothetical protein
MGRDACRILVETPEGKGSLGIPMRKWEDNITIHIQGTGIRGMDRKGKGPLGPPMRKWEDKITIHIQGTGIRDMERIDLAHDRDRLQALSTR